MANPLDYVDIAIKAGGAEVATNAVATVVTTTGVGAGTAGAVGSGVAALSGTLASLGGPAAGSLTAIAACNPVGLGAIAIGAAGVGLYKLIFD